MLLSPFTGCIWKQSSDFGNPCVYMGQLDRIKQCNCLISIALSNATWRKAVSLWDIKFIQINKAYITGFELIPFWGKNICSWDSIPLRRRATETPSAVVLKTPTSLLPKSRRQPVELVTRLSMLVLTMVFVSFPNRSGHYTSYSKPNVVFPSTAYNPAKNTVMRSISLLFR